MARGGCRGGLGTRSIAGARGAVLRERGAERTAPVAFVRAGGDPEFEATLDVAALPARGAMWNLSVVSADGSEERLVAPPCAKSCRTPPGCARTTPSTGSAPS